jgi:C1A family cysteine protease
VTSIKDQGESGSCWAFSAIKAMESNLLLSNQATDNLDLSESHLSWYTYHPSTLSSDTLYGEGASYMGYRNSEVYLLGGDSLSAIFTLARWSGAVTEAAAPFSASTYSEISSMANAIAAEGNSLQYKADYKLTDSLCYDAASRSQIKEAIMENGAMAVSFYTDPEKAYYHTTALGGTAYYQSYLTGQRAIDNANHSVTIVGWDDTYSKENFGTYKPSSDGAWLIANSWGSEGWGDNGYFWISYEEPSLTEYYSFISTSADTYDKNYQYDAFGYGAFLTVDDGSYYQSLKAVGFYTLTDNQAYSISVYRNPTAGKPASGTLAATASGTMDFQGYHTVSLPETVLLSPGETFSVVVTYQNTNGNTVLIPLEGTSYRSGEIVYDYTSHAGESYLYTADDGWQDTNRSRCNNVCVKAFTTNEEVAPGIVSLSKSSVTLGKGETYTVNATVTQAADQTLTWTSSDTSVASVNANGKITAKSTGTATITATLPYGGSAECRITVKKAPTKITATPAKKTIKKKKSFTIKTTLSSGSASNKITYSSSKPSVAKVSASGKVTGVKKGTAVITITTYNKKKAKIRVTVK